MALHTKFTQSKQFRIYNRSVIINTFKICPIHMYYKYLNCTTNHCVPVLKFACFMIYSGTASYFYDFIPSTLNCKKFT